METNGGEAVGIEIKSSASVGGMLLVASFEEDLGKKFAGIVLTPRKKRRVLEKTRFADTIFVERKKERKITEYWLK